MCHWRKTVVHGVYLVLEQKNLRVVEVGYVQSFLAVFQKGFFGVGGQYGPYDKEFLLDLGQNRFEDRVDILVADEAQPRIQLVYRAVAFDADVVFFYTGSPD